MKLFRGLYLLGLVVYLKGGLILFSILRMNYKSCS